MPRLYISHRGHVGVGFGCLGGLAYLFVYAMIGMFYVVALGAVLALALTAYVVAFSAMGIDWLLLRYSDGYRLRRDGRRVAWPADVSAMLNSAFSKRRRTR